MLLGSMPPQTECFVGREIIPAAADWIPAPSCASRSLLEAWCSRPAKIFHAVSPFGHERLFWNFHQVPLHQGISRSVRIMPAPAFMPEHWQATFNGSLADTMSYSRNSSVGLPNSALAPDVTTLNSWMTSGLGKGILVA